MNYFEADAVTQQTCRLSEETLELIRQARQESLTFQRLRDSRWRSRIEVDQDDAPFTEPDEKLVEACLFC